MVDAGEPWLQVRHVLRRIDIYWAFLDDDERLRVEDASYVAAL